MFGKWLNQILNGLSNIYRWEGRQRLIKKNDAEHSFGVAVIADGLARIEKEIFNNEVNQLKVLRAALYHDATETVLGDIISGIKKKTPAMRKALEEVEYKLYKESMEPNIPTAWRTDFEKYLLNPKENLETIEGKIIAAADNIDALNECIQEIILGNTTFEPYLVDIANTLLSIELDSVEYFIKNCLGDLGLPIEYYGDEIVRFVDLKKIK